MPLENDEGEQREGRKREGRRGIEEVD